MKMIVRRTALAVCTLVLALILPTAASAACTGFDDVLESADCYESVMYLAEPEITQGTGDGCFSPDAPVTTSQWAVMLCRAYGVETNGSTWSELSQNAVEQSFRKGWLSETAVSTPNTQLCRGALYKSALPQPRSPFTTAYSMRAACRCPIMKTASASGRSFSSAARRMM